MANRRRIERFLIATLLGAALAVGTTADAPRANYAEVTSAAVASAGACTQVSAIAAPAASAVAPTPTEVARAERPTVVGGPFARRLYLTNRALLL